MAFIALPGSNDCHIRAAMISFVGDILERDEECLASRRRLIPNLQSRTRP